MTKPRYLDQCVAGDHCAIGSLCFVRDVIAHRRWWQFWRPRWWAEDRMCLVLADRSLLDVTSLLATPQPSGAKIRGALEEIEQAA